LRAAGHGTLIVCGVITNNSVESSVRMAGNLGFKTYLAADACYTFPRLDWNGQLWSAEQVHALSLANLHGEYCTMANTALYSTVRKFWSCPRWHRYPGSMPDGESVPSPDPHEKKGNRKRPRRGLFAVPVP